MPRPLFSLVLLHCALVLSVAPAWASDAAADNEELQEALQRTYEPLDLRLFGDSIGHWKMKDGREHQYDRYQPEQIVHIAENLLRYQNEDGGWAKNIDCLANVDPHVIRELRGGTLGKSTFDNRTTYSQIEYLAKVFKVTGLERYRKGAERGLFFTLDTQNESGGWKGSDVDAVTYNDDVMTGVMRLLLRIRENAPEYDWVSTEMRSRLSDALDRAIQVTLNCQIEVDGQLTAWCQQHDHKTLKPIKARAYELPSICSSESASVVRFLMELPAPDDRVIAAVDAAVAWLDEVKIENVRIEEVKIKPVVFKHHTAKFDRVAVEDPNAPPIWARFYEIKTSKPFFCRRDGTKVDSLAEVDLERRSGYGWYTHKPEHLLSVEYPKWKARISK
ncbi:MAG: pectate lyase [Planctomyces sp.]|nr:pectate lyase [Planctomyces sp.]